MAACAQCGLIWGQLSVDSLLAHLEKFPSEDVEAWLKHAHNTPL